MRRKGISVCLVMLLLLGSIVVLDVNMDITLGVEAITIYVDDDYGSEDATHKMTIQAAVDAANPGDTIYVCAGVYNEDVSIDKTLTLAGEDRDNTIINSTNQMGIYVTNADYVNISGFTIINGNWAGIRLMPSDNSLIENCRVEMNNYGIQIIDSNNTVVKDNIVINNHDYAGIYLYNSDNILIENNTILENSIGIWIRDNSDYNGVIFNNVSLNNDGIHLGGQSHYNTLTNNFIDSNNVGNPSAHGIFVFNSHDNTVINNTVSNNQYGIFLRYIDTSYNNYIANCTISNSTAYDIQIKDTYQGRILNTTFNKSLIRFEDAMVPSNLEVQWYLHINVTDTLGQPMPNIDVCIKDNQNSLPAQKYTTDSQGYIRWLTQTEYIEQDTNGDTVGEKTYYTPHRITAWNETLMGYAEVNINESKEVNIVLDTPYYEIPLSAGWNLISLPLEQSDTSIPTVLSSIAGNYDIVQWYNASDGQWHSTDDDLTDINHTMGFWIHMKTADTLILTGTIPNTTSIQLYQGWNLVGNPSFCIHSIDDILSPIATKYTAVQQYDSLDSGDPWKHYHINKPSNLNDLAYMTSGRGYWLYVKEDCVWEVSNF